MSAPTSNQVLTRNQICSWSPKVWISNWRIGALATWVSKVCQYISFSPDILHKIKRRMQKRKGIVFGCSTTVPPLGIPHQLSLNVIYRSFFFDISALFRKSLSQPFVIKWLLFWLLSSGTIKTFVKISDSLKALFSWNPCCVSTVLLNCSHFLWRPVFNKLISHFPFVSLYIYKILRTSVCFIMLQCSFATKDLLWQSYT